MRVSIDDPALRSRAIQFLRARPNSRARDLASHLDLVQTTCDRMLMLMQHDGLVSSCERALGGIGRPARLFSATRQVVQPIEKTPAEMADDIQLVMMGQPWPSILIMPRPGERAAEYPE